MHIKTNLFQKVLKREKNLTDVYLRKSIILKHRKRKIIPDEYFINVITTIPERKTVLESIDI